MTSLLIALGWGGLGYVMGHIVRNVDESHKSHVIRGGAKYLLPPPFNWLFPIRAKESPVTPRAAEGGQP